MEKILTSSQIKNKSRGHIRTTITFFFGKRRIPTRSVFQLRRCMKPTLPDFRINYLLWTVLCYSYSKSLLESSTNDFTLEVMPHGMARHGILFCALKFIESNVSIYDFPYSLSIPWPHQEDLVLYVTILLYCSREARTCCSTHKPTT